MRDKFNARFLIGLPLWRSNSIEMARKMMQKAEATLGSALIGFELGNEVGGRLEGQRHGVCLLGRSADGLGGLFPCRHSHAYARRGSHARLRGVPPSKHSQPPNRTP